MRSLRNQTPMDADTRQTLLSQSSLANLVSFTLRRAQATLLEGVELELKRYDVSYVQFACLLLVSEHDDLSQSDLGHLLGIDRSSMVQHVDRLEARGLLTRQQRPEDRRSYRLGLKPDGRTLVAQLLTDVRHFEDRQLAVFDREQRAILLELLSGVSDHKPFIPGNRHDNL